MNVKQIHETSLQHQHCCQIYGKIGFVSDLLNNFDDGGGCDCGGCS